jgi:hypothetical protein
MRNQKNPRLCGRPGQVFLGEPEGEDEDHAVSKVEPPIRYDHTIMDRFESARRELKEHIKNCLNTEQTKVGSRVTLRFDVVNSPALSPEQKELVMSRLGNRIGKMVYFVSFRSRPTARQKIGSSGNEYLQDEKGHHLSAANSPCGGLFEFLALKGLHRVAQGI